MICFLILYANLCLLYDVTRLALKGVTSWDNLQPFSIFLVRLTTKRGQVQPTCQIMENYNSPQELPNPLKHDFREQQSLLDSCNFWNT